MAFRDKISTQPARYPTKIRPRQKISVKPDRSYNFNPNVPMVPTDVSIENFGTYLMAGITSIVNRAVSNILSGNFSSDNQLPGGMPEGYKTIRSPFVPIAFGQVPFSTIDAKHIKKISAGFPWAMDNAYINISSYDLDLDNNLPSQSEVDELRTTVFKNADTNDEKYSTIDSGEENLYVAPQIDQSLSEMINTSFWHPMPEGDFSGLLKDIIPRVPKQDEPNGVDQQEFINAPSAEFKDGVWKLEDAPGIWARNKWQNFPGRTRPITIPNMILNSGPDFMTNKFDAYFLWDPNDVGAKSFDDAQNILISPHATNLEKSILSHGGFAVRIGQITIPGMTNEEFNVPFMETQINKIRTTKKVDNQSSFTFRMDQDLIWMEEFQLLAGRVNTVDESLLTGDTKHPAIRGAKQTQGLGTVIDTTLKANNSPTNVSWHHLIQCVAKTWPSKSISDYRIQTVGLCLIVKMVHFSNWINLNYQQEVLPYFVFENVKILGASGNIQYNSSSAEPADATINFIYKRCYQLIDSDLNCKVNTSGKSWVRTKNSRKGDPLPLNFEDKGYIPNYDESYDMEELQTPDMNVFIENGGTLV